MTAVRCVHGTRKLVLVQGGTAHWLTFVNTVTAHTHTHIRTHAHVAYYLFVAVQVPL